MQRPRVLALITTTAVACALGPVLAASAVAADPVIVVNPGDTLTGISKRTNVPMSELIRLNAISDPNRIFAGQTLRIGTDGSGAPLPVATPAPVTATAAQLHAVQRGENLISIARHYGVSVDDIVLANGIANPSRIFAGQQLTIPGSASAPPATAPAPVVATPAPVTATAAQLHAVQRGENLISIARHYGVSVDDIVLANGIANPSRIFAGQQLTIPGSAPAPPATAPAPPSMPPSMQALVAGRADVRQVIVDEAARFGVPAALALAVAWQESGWRQSVVSRAGAVGVMQLMPATATWVGEAMLGTTVNMYETRENVRAGVQLLAYYLARYAGSRELALAAYYQGQRAVDLYGIYAVTRPYVASILALERLFGG